MVYISKTGNILIKPDSFEFIPTNPSRKSDVWKMSNYDNSWQVQFKNKQVISLKQDAKNNEILSFDFHGSGAFTDLMLSQPVFYNSFHSLCMASNILQLELSDLNQPDSIEMKKISCTVNLSK